MTVPAFLPARVTVTAEHIAQGDPGVCSSCPIALALAEVINGPARRAHIQVFAGKAVVLDGGRVWSAALPGEAQDFIGRFDTAKTVGPFSFGLTWREGGLTWREGDET